MKQQLKNLFGIIREKRFGIDSGEKVYIGKNCSIKGRKLIHLENFVTIRPYAQIFLGGGQYELRKALR